MSRDFILIFSGGMVSLVTTLVVLFVADFLYRRAQAKQAASESARLAPVKPEPAHPPESKTIQSHEDQPA